MSPKAGPVGASVAVVGVGELVKAMDSLAPELADLFRADLAEMLDQLVVPDARTKIGSRRAAATIHAVPTSTGAAIVAGSAAVPWYGWLDFGSRDPNTGQRRRVGPWTHTGVGPRGGRAIYPAIEQNEKAIVQAAEYLFDRAAASTGLI